MRSINKVHKIRILEDISNIQKIFDNQLFTIAVNLFLEKWRKINSSAITLFLNYFENQWCSERNNGWYEGYAPGLPSTSNALESTHEKIKSALDGKRLGLIKFMEACRDNILPDWSIERSPTIIIIDPVTNVRSTVENLNIKIFNDSPIIVNKDLVKAYKLNSLNKTIIHLKNDNYYYVCSNDKVDITKNDCKMFIQSIQDRNLTTFDSMVNAIFCLYRIKYNDDDWKLSTCSCWYWLKHYKCHHQITIAARKKKCSFHAVGMDVPIQANRKKGRPKNNVNSLQKQPNETQSVATAPKGIDSDEDVVLPEVS